MPTKAAKAGREFIRDTSLKSYADPLAEWGHIYIIQHGDCAYYKIGVSTVLEKEPGEARLLACQTGNPILLQIVFTAFVSDPYAVEAYLHARFEKWNIRGEWYHLTRAQLEIAKTYLKKHGDVGRVFR